MAKLKRDNRMQLFFSWADGKGDFIDLPYGMLKDIVKILERYDQYCVPMVMAKGQKFFFVSETGKLEPLE